MQDIVIEVQIASSYTETGGLWRLLHRVLLPVPLNLPLLTPGTTTGNPVTTGKQATVKRVRNASSRTETRVLLKWLALLVFCLRMTTEYSVAIGSRETVRTGLIASSHTYIATLLHLTAAVSLHPAMMVPKKYKFAHVLMSLQRRLMHLGDLIGAMAFATFGKRVIAHEGIIAGSSMPMISPPTLRQRRKRRPKR